MRWIRTVFGVAVALSIALVGHEAAAQKKLKIFLSMSFIGNDWQADAANMV